MLFAFVVVLYSTLLGYFFCVLLDCARELQACDEEVAKCDALISELEAARR